MKLSAVAVGTETRKTGVKFCPWVLESYSLPSDSLFFRPRLAHILCEDFLI